jgi:hypothetical protein
LTAGVNVTLAGVVVGPGLLKAPAPAGLNVQVAEVPVAMVAPDKVIGVGVAEEQMLLMSGPALTFEEPTVMILVSVAGAQSGLLPSGSSEVRTKVTTPAKFAAGVKVTLAGLDCILVELKVPEPEGAAIDQRPLRVVLDTPDIDAPVNVIGLGLADWHALLISGPASTVKPDVIVMEIVSL